MQPAIVCLLDRPVRECIVVHHKGVVHLLPCHVLYYFSTNYAPLHAGSDPCCQQLR
jgi:hypothetical protein